MKNTIVKATFLAAAITLALSSCTLVPEEEIGKPGDDNRITFVVSVPAEDSKGVLSRSTGAKGGNGHFTKGVPEDYRNYSADADTVVYGTAFGGYPDAEAEAKAFEQAVAAMAANFKKSGAVLPQQQTGDISATRAITEGSVQDNQINEITILLFNADTERYIETINVAAADISDFPGDYRRKRFTIERPDGDYKALFFANSRTEVGQYVSAHPNTTIAELRAGLVLPVTPPSSGIQQDGIAVTVFPMSSKVEELRFPSTRDFEMYPIELIRMYAKINISTPTDSPIIIKRVHIRNNNHRGRLVPSPNWSRDVGVFDPSALNEEVSTNPQVNTNYNIYSAQSIDNIFVHESSVGSGDPEDEYQDAFTILFSVNQLYQPGRYAEEIFLPDTWYRVNLLGTDPRDGAKRLANIVRNHRYDINITGITAPGYATEAEALANPPVGLEYELNAWNDGEENMNDHTFNGNYQLSTDRSVVVIGPDAGASATLKVYTDHIGGWTSEISRTSTSTYDLATDAPTNVANSTKATTLTITLTNEYTTSAVSRSVLLIKAGSLFKQILIIRLPRPSNINLYNPHIDPSTSYTGAFWKADQTGERLISIGQNGKNWSAFVLEGADWVVMDAKPSTDPNVRTTNGPALHGNDEDFDRAHSVNSTLGWAHGTSSPDGYFRIGLRSAYAPTEDKPARYAVVAITEENLFSYYSSSFPIKHLLYLRQGEGADYLMRPDEPGNPVPSRPLARKWLPYNLTAPEFMGNGVPGEQTPWVDVRPDWQTTVDPAASLAVPADYPTQAGAHFKWANAEGVRAYNPSGNPASAADWDWGMDDTAVSGYWDQLVLASGYQPAGTVRNLYESCPPGYRRPKEGTTSEFTVSYVPWADSEADQSLLFSTTGNINDNSITGFYADGYFDRGLIGAEPGDGTTANTAVGTGTSAVAYTGRLFFNPTSLASLFFPFSGWRNSVTVELGLPGLYTRIWLSGSNHNRYGWARTISNVGFNRDADSRWQGNVIRCVVDPVIPPGTGGEGSRPQLAGHLAPAFTLAVDANGILNLDGQNEVLLPNGTRGVRPNNYLVSFKFGSLVALGMGTGYDPGGNYYNRDVHVAWVPPGYTPPIEYYEILTTKDISSNDPLVGLGDPCTLAVKDGVVGNYIMPTRPAAMKTESTHLGAVGNWSSDDSFFLIKVILAYNASGHWSPASGSVGYYWVNYYYNSGAYIYMSNGLLWLNAPSPAYPLTEGWPIRCEPKTLQPGRRIAPVAETVAAEESRITAGSATTATTSPAQN